MQIFESVEEMRFACRAARLSGRTLGLVPTMGALHEGHLSLVRASRARCDVTAASIFVNPTQFAAHEDLGKYPRTFHADCELLAREGVEMVFAPGVAAMYPPGASTWVEVAGVQDRLDGVSRPGHFRGVATVVAKLLHIVAPSHAFFGEKDAAQLAVLRKMVRDLHFDVEIVSGPIVREPDGLAMSSRNRFLNADERSQALVLQRALRVAGDLAGGGESSSAALCAAMRAVITEAPLARIDYVSVVDPETLADIPDIGRGGLLAVAAWFGTTRLIDNSLIAHP